ncbi:hypothetical protein BKA80DRAFT_341899 [Phyllosticta citrichinensis]
MKDANTFGSIETTAISFWLSEGTLNCISHIYDNGNYELRQLHRTSHYILVGHHYHLDIEIYDRTCQEKWSPPNCIGRGLVKLKDTAGADVAAATTTTTAPNAAGPAPSGPTTPVDADAADAAADNGKEGESNNEDGEGEGDKEDDLGAAPTGPHQNAPPST